MHDDELAWAACEMYLATGNVAYQTTLESSYDPSNPATIRWSWWRLFEGYGCAARDYAFAASNGRLQASQLDPVYLAKCTTQITAAGNDALLRTQQCAYGSAFDSNSKRFETAGWYFSSERAFDMTAANLISPNPAYTDAVMTNLNFEGGCNPANVCYITGLGVKRQRDIVNQFFQNDKRSLPPSGIPIGNIITGFQYLSPYGSTLGSLTFLSDGLTTTPTPFYDRWGDSYNTTAEAITVNAARSLASLSYFAAQTPAASQPWTPPLATLTVPSGYVPVGTPATITLNAPAGLDLSAARIVWEAAGGQLAFSGSTWTITENTVGDQWVEAEAAWPDGRRIAAASDFQTRSNPGSNPFTLDANTVALYHFDSDYTDVGPNQLKLTAQGNTTLASNVGWMTNPSGQVARFSALGDTLSVTIPAKLLFATAGKPGAITMEAMIYPRAYKAYSINNYPVVALYENYDSCLEIEDGKWDSPANPFMYAGPTTLVSAAQWKAAVSTGTWHSLKMTLAANGIAQCTVDGNLIASGSSNFNFTRTTNWTLTLGNMDGDVDEVRVSNIVR